MSKQEFLEGFECMFCGHIGAANECCSCQDPEYEDDAVYGVGFL